MPSPAATALNDQLTAATRDAHQHLTDVAHQLGARLDHDHHPHPWLAAQAHALLHALNTGQAHGCPHITGHPQLVRAAAWHPHLITCAPCAPTLLTPAPGEDTTCDRCRTQAHPIHSNLAGIGPILLNYGLCTPCHHQIHNNERKA